MPARYKPRHVHHDAGRFTLATTVEPDGSALVSVLYITPDGGLQTVCHLSGHPDAAPGESVLNVCDAYDSSNRLAIAPGGGRPAPIAGVGQGRCDYCPSRIATGVLAGPPDAGEPCDVCRAHAVLARDLPEYLR